MSQLYPAGRALCWAVGIYHAVLGLLLLISGELSIRAAQSLYGWTIEGSPALGIAGEILGCYFLAFGLMMAAAGWDPVKNRAAITVGVVLFALRLLQRLIFADKVIEVFQVDSGRYWGAFVFVLLLGVALALFRLAVHRRLGEASAA